MLRNAEAKHYLKLSYTEDDSDSSNLLGLAEKHLSHKTSERKETHQVSIIALFFFFAELGHFNICSKSLERLFREII